MGYPGQGDERKELRERVAQLEKELERVRQSTNDKIEHKDGVIEQLDKLIGELTKDNNRLAAQVAAVRGFVEPEVLELRKYNTDEDTEYDEHKLGQESMGQSVLDLLDSPVEPVRGAVVGHSVNKNFIQAIGRPMFNLNIVIDEHRPDLREEGVTVLLVPVKEEK